MSRIGNKPIAIPAGVTVQVDGSTVTVKGAKGELTRTVHSNMAVEVEGATVHVKRPDDTKLNKSLHGLTRTLVANMVTGVSEGYKKELEINGVGYRSAKEGKELVLRHVHAHARLGDEPLRRIVRRNEGDKHLRDLGVFIKMRRFSQTAQCVAQRRGASESVPVRPLMRHQKIIVVRAKIRGAFQKFHGYPFSPSLGEASSRWRMMSLM